MSSFCTVFWYRLIYERRFNLVYEIPEVLVMVRPVAMLQMSLLNPAH